MAVSLAVLAGCGEEPGQATAPPGATTTPAAQTTAASESATGGEVFAGLDKCELLDTILEGEGFPSGEISEIRKTACDSSKKGSGVVGLNMQEGTAYDYLPLIDSSKKIPGKVNGRAVIFLRDSLDGGGGCDVSMEVRPESRVVVSVTLDETEPACEFAMELAERVEPLLPGK